ncbi:hypothetical protein Syun_013639 [Stephania yunnanensis]|uniref:Transducin/WD40 repeat-like superfamily protein n=1 Tax=Stephania yunnanensis TaxID=152371 RepID=A0AAP0JHZ6_9MAGN
MRHLSDGGVAGGVEAVHQGVDAEGGGGAGGEVVGEDGGDVVLVRGEEIVETEERTMEASRVVWRRSILFGWIEDGVATDMEKLDLIYLFKLSGNRDPRSRSRFPFKRMDSFIDDYDTFEESDQFDDFSDDEYDVDENELNADTSALDARNGKDMQGIPWERLRFSREKYREMRLKQYKNFENCPGSNAKLEKEHSPSVTESSFYDFHFNTRLVKSTIVHFQLRNLLWATSKHDVYLMQNYSVMHWSSLLKRGKEVLNASGPLVPTLNFHGSLAQSLSRVQICTMAVKKNLLVAGGYHGELICKNLNSPGVVFCTKVSSNDNAMTNAVDVFQDTRLMTANNDAAVRVFDTEKFMLLNQFSFPWSVNNTSVSPDGKLLTVLGDSIDCLLADAQSGKGIRTIASHLAWHPDGWVFATGSQDKTCRLWDVRKLSDPLDVLHGKIGAIRAIKFTSDGQFMAMAEPADFVHIYSAQSGYRKRQLIDLFGEIAGVSFSPDSTALYIGVADRTYGSLLEFNRKRCNQYLDVL